MFANLAELKAEFGISGGTGGDINIDLGNIMGALGSEGPAAGPVHAFEIINAAKCSSNHGLAQAMETMNMADECVMGPLRILADIVNALSAILGGIAAVIPLAEIGKLLGALTGGIQSLGCINLGIAQIHVKIQAQAQIAGGAITSGVGSWIQVDTGFIERAKKIRDMLKNKKKLKEFLKEKAKSIAESQPAWAAAMDIKNRVKKAIGDTRELVKDIDDKEKQAMNTLDAILKMAHILKNLICSIFALLLAFVAALQGVEIGIGVVGTIVAETVQVLQAIMSILAKFFACLQDLLNFLASLCVEAETISVKMFTSTLSSVKEKFRELKYAPMATAGGA